MLFFSNFSLKNLYFRSSQISTTSDEVMYEAVAQVSSQSNAATVKSTSSGPAPPERSGPAPPEKWTSDDPAPARPPPPTNTSKAASKVEQALRMIPRLEDKYDVASNLDELVNISAQASETRSEASYTSSVSSKVTQQSSNYSSMSSKSREMTKNQQQTTGTGSSQGSMISNQSSVKTLKDSSYSTASSIASSKTSTENFGKNSEVAYSKFIDSLTRANEQ